MLKYLRDYKYYLCKLLFKAGILKKLNFTLSKKQGNKTFQIPVLRCAGFTNLSSQYEQWFDKLLKAVLHKPDAVMIDVGVNIGQTLLKVASFHDGITYLGFEPNSTCYAYARQLVLKNKLSNYKIFPVGLSDKAQLLSLAGDNDYAAGGSVVPNFRSNVSLYANTQLVPLMEGDAVLEQEHLPKIDFLKVDVEGAELEVMQGLKKTVQRYTPVVMLEILPVYNEQKPNGRQRKERQDALLNLMRAYGYMCYLINEQSLALERMDAVPVHSDMSKTNYLFLHPLNEEVRLGLDVNVGE